jgi:hypothetical protein
MKYLKIILVLVVIIFCSTNCNARSNNKNDVTDKSFQVFLDKFKTINPPLNYKKLTEPISSMTKEEAIKFLHKTEKDFIDTIWEASEDGEPEAYIREHTAGCDFKYKLNDNIFILCTRDGGQGDTFFVYLNSFSTNGKLISKCAVGEHLTLDSDWISFVLLDKKHIRVFHYEDNNSRKKDGWRSIYYYINYFITDDGKFIEQDKSGITYLQKIAIQYSTYKPNSGDPMNKYE